MVPKLNPPPKPRRAWLRTGWKFSRLSRWWSGKRSSMLPASQSFYTQELQRALSESSWGIKKSAVTLSGPLQAAALVTLLEGYSVTITLSLAGYTADPLSNPGTGQCLPDAPFESIEPLLQSLSPMYERQRQALLFQRLEMLS